MEKGRGRMVALWIMKNYWGCIGWGAGRIGGNARRHCGSKIKSEQIAAVGIYATEKDVKEPFMTDIAYADDLSSFRQSRNFQAAQPGCFM